MEFPLGPNIAYLVLLIGFLVAVFAVLTPGTGFFEIGAIVALVVSGWAIYTYPINGWALIVLILGVFPFLIALRRTDQRIYLGISAFALMIGSAYLFQGEVWWQPGVNPVLAAVGSISGGALLWFIAIKLIETESLTPSHDISGIVGSIGEAKTEVHHEGSVYVGGETWSARSEKPIKEGARVKVIGREGFILDVESQDG